MPEVIAHRGASAHALENSLAAFRLAIEMEADGIELDVHATADGTFAVHHDPLLAGRPIGDLTAAEAGSHRLPNGESLPFLNDVLDVAADRTALYIEIKSLRAEHDRALLDLLQNGPAPARYHIHAFDHRIIRRLRDQQPTLRCGVLSTSYPVQPLAAVADAGATELWQEDSMIDRELATSMRDTGYRLIAWTVDEPGRMTDLATLGVDGICTNRPDVARSVVQ